MKVDEAIDFLINELQINKDQSYEEWRDQVIKVDRVIGLLQTYDHIIEAIKKIEGVL